jgi:hypothetical protein
MLGERALADLASGLARSAGRGEMGPVAAMKGSRSSLSGFPLAD